MRLEGLSFQGGRRTATTWVLAFLLTGCSSVLTPSEQTARKVFEVLNKRQIEIGNLRVKSFKKTKDQILNQNGHKIYKLEYEVQVEGLDERVGLEHFSPGEIAKAKGGETIDRKGILTFEQTDRGWMAQDGKLY